MAIVTAVLAVTATGNYQPDDLLKAAIAAALPPALRYLNIKDTSFGRGA
jgi:hypothetical protein